METMILNIILTLLIFGVGMLTGMYITLYIFKKYENK